MRAPLAIGGTIASAASTAASDDKAKLKQTAQQFEAIFLRQLMASMRSASLSEDDLFGSDAGQQFRDMGDAKTAEAMSQKGVFGVADMLLKQFMGRPATTVAASAATSGATP